jgi:hypothetical protein
MGIEISRYQFHSWARKGIASTIEEPDDLGTGTSIITQRAGINLPVLLNEALLTKSFNLVGPGDIIGINGDMIVRTQPLNWITDFEPNYLAFAEFYDEDFLWRYTPASPKIPGALPDDLPTDKLRPWLFLLIVKEDEFERTKRKMPLPSITLKSNNVFPPANETWLWAHVHSDANIPDAETNTLEEFLISLNKNVTTDPDQLYCRLMSPRKLEASTAYYAFLIPAFETGRLAGLGETEENIKKIIAQTPSWTNAGANGEMPVYFEWFFRTGVNEDFESLIKRLEPVEMDARVGIRAMDCSKPGFVKAKPVNNDDDFPPTSPDVLGLEGALKSPKAVPTNFPEAGDQFQTELQEIVNLPIEIIGTDENSGDPIISVPLYGGKHAKKSLDKDIPLDITKDTWLHDLNKDPRTRVAAGFGTLAVQKNQETYMRKAWAQIQNILDANKQIKATVFHMNVAVKFAQKTFNQVSSNVLIAMSRPVLGRIMGSPTTLYQQIKESQLPAAVFSGAFRKLAAPNRRFSKKYAGKENFEYDKVVTGLNDGKLTAAPPKETPGGVFTLKDAADKISPNKYPDWIVWLLDNRKIIAIALLVVFIILAVVTGLYIVFATLAAVTAGGYFYANKLANDKNTAEEVIDPQKQLDAIPNIPPQPEFTIKLDKEATVPPPTTTSRTTDSVEAKNYRSALIDMTKRLALKEPEKTIVPLSLNNTHAKVREGIDPRNTFPRRLSALIKFPEYIKIDEPATIFPAMAYPDMEDPMYKKLTAISDEAFLANLRFIKNNTISLLVTNPKFIESYMVGLNHEMGRELLWREYPTDQRGSYFRQFWDVNGIISPSSPDGQLTASEKAAFKDITPIHTWDEETEKLGTHNNRKTETEDEEQLVLTIRGDLLKKYPNTLVFAQKAIAASDNDEDSDDGTKIERELSDEDFKKKVKFPLYRAEVLPDIKFFGFDLTLERAKGTAPTPDEDNFGWYFVIMQAPGAPVFGMDINFNQGDDGLSWDDLSWESFSEEIKFIKKGVIPTISPVDPNPITPITWGADSASMAYILFQKPNMVAVHAKKMLKGL